MTINVPDNWVELNQGNSVWFAPQGGYGQSGFTHGVNVGIAQTQSRNLAQASEELNNSLMQSNRNLRRVGTQRTTADGRTALLTTLSNVNESTGRLENIRIVTTQTRNGEMLYMVFVQPNGAERVFDNAFNEILRSVRIND